MGNFPSAKKERIFQGNLCLFLTIKSKNYKLRAFLPCRGKLMSISIPVLPFPIYFSFISFPFRVGGPFCSIYWIYPRKRNTRQAVVYRRRWNVSKTHQIVKFQRVPEEGGFKIETVVLLSVKALYGPTWIRSKTFFFLLNPCASHRAVRTTRKMRNRRMHVHFHDPDLFFVLRKEKRKNKKNVSIFITFAQFSQYIFASRKLNFLFIVIVRR